MNFLAEPKDFKSVLCAESCAPFACNRLKNGMLGEAKKCCKKYKKGKKPCKSCPKH